MEKFYHFKREGDVQRGDVSQEYYIEWLETNDKKFLEEIVIDERKKFWPYENLSNSKLELLVNKLKRVFLGVPSRRIR